MNIKRALLALLPLAALAATGADPSLEVQSDRVQLHGLIAGERVARETLREPVGDIELVRVLRGVETVRAPSVSGAMSVSAVNIKTWERESMNGPIGATLKRATYRKQAPCLSGRVVGILMAVAATEVNQ